MLETMIITIGPSLVVGVLFWIWWLIMHRPRRVLTRAPAPVLLGPPAVARLETERQLTAAVESFEQFVADMIESSGNAEILVRLDGLGSEEKRRLSSECANAIGIVFSNANRSREALFWLDQSAERDPAYFRELNAAIARQIAGTTGGTADLPKYPLPRVLWPGLAARTMLKAQLLHDLGRHSEVESLLFAYTQTPSMRYVRAELRRQRGDITEALADYLATAAWNPDYKQVQHWIAELSPPAATLLKVEPLRAMKRDANSEAPAPAAEIVRLARPSLGTTPWEVLGIRQGAPPEDVHAASLALSRQYHPDRAASHGPEMMGTAEEEMRENQPSLCPAVAPSDGQEGSGYMTSRRLRWPTATLAFCGAFLFG